jgi:hypothetical protein
MAAMIATAALPAAARSVAALLADVGGAPADDLRRLERKLFAAWGLAAGAEAREGRDAGARAWLRDLRDALYELGDAVDDSRRAAAEATRRHREGRRSVSTPSVSVGSDHALNPPFVCLRCKTKKIETLANFQLDYIELSTFEVVQLRRGSSL